jgi:SWI/SNF-related matrix-associated actin-dependent regulator 1 of chromatin subfamily A
VRELYGYQRIAVAWLAARRVALLADDPGLGKTAEAIAAADQIGARLILVLVPAIAAIVWEREFSAWQRMDRAVQVVRSSADAADLRGDVVVVSYSMAPRILAALRGQRWDLVIADEAQALKNPGSLRTKTFYGRHGLVGVVKRVWLLSGTFMLNNPAELWVHYRVLLKGELAYQQFIDRYCRVHQTEYGPRITGANPDHIEELAAIFAPHWLGRKQQDVLPDLPMLRFDTIPVTSSELPMNTELSTDEQDILEKLRLGLPLSAYQEIHLTTLRRVFSTLKAPLVAELVQAELEGNTDKIVVFAWHRTTISTIVDALGSSVAGEITGSTSSGERQRLIDAFQG